MDEVVTPQVTDTLQEVKPNPPQVVPAAPLETVVKVDEFIDPGQLEGRRNEAVNKINEPPVNSKRWNQIYWENKEKERKLQESQAVIAEKDKIIQELQVKVVPAPIQPQPIHTPAPANVPPYNQITPEQIDNEIQQLRELKARAYGETDMASVSQYEDRIFDLKETKRLIVSEVTNAQKEVNGFIGEVNWLSPENPKYDPIMQGAAIYLDNELIKTWQGSVRSRLEEVKKRIEARFNYNAVVSTSPEISKESNVGLDARYIPPTVQGVITSLSHGTPKITLTEEQRAVAKKMFGNRADAEQIYYQNLTGGKL